MDVSKFIIAKSDQLNADDLVGGPITVQITGTTKGSAEQPVVVKISGGHCPWKPSKTALRCLVAAWGTESDKWAGRWVTLHRDESVTWAGQAVGGIRVSALSHIDGPVTLSLAISKGKKVAHRIGVIRPADAKQAGAPTADIDALLAEAVLTREDVDRWLVAAGKPTLGDSAPDKVAGLAGWLAGDGKRLDAIRALIPAAREPGDDGAGS